MVRTLCILITLATCAGKDEAADTGTPADTDSGTNTDTDTDTDTDADTQTDTDPVLHPLLRGASGNCVDAVCTWSVFTSPGVGIVKLDIVETGDPAYECPPDRVCDVWHEFHDDFSLLEFDKKGESWAIELALVPASVQQGQNESTIFDVADTATSGRITVMFTITDTEGVVADCVVYGHAPEHFSDVCTSVW